MLYDDTCRYLVLLQMDGKLDATDELDDERTSDFFARALAESRRYNILSPRDELTKPVTTHIYKHYY